MKAGAFGDGHFGNWDEAEGKPYYRYTHARDADHYHLIGNARLTATCHTKGHVQVYDWSRGFRCLNFAGLDFGPGGGYVRVSMGNACVTTLGNVPQEIRFGADYFEKYSLLDALHIEERIEAPPGDDPVILHTVTLTNNGEDKLELDLTACWTARHHPICAIPVLPKQFLGMAHGRRAKAGMRFKTTIRWDAHSHCRVATYTPPDKAPPREKRTYRDFHPKAIFLACLDADAEPAVPEGGEPAGADLWLRTRVRLAPGEKRMISFLFGTTAEEQIAGLVERCRGSRAGHRASVAFAAPSAPQWLERELKWHAAYLQAGVCFMDYFGAHTIDQGSAYSYLQGGTGAPRDMTLFILPMVYLRPELAKDMLRFLMRAQRKKDGSFPYAFFGHGATSGAGVHSQSSDLDLFVFWALSEYLNATRDYDFLNETEPFYPIERGDRATVLEHVRASFQHLISTIGIGPNGLLRCGTGDWNDVLCGFSKLPLVTAWRGESTLNAGMATLVLPAMAGAVERADAELAGRMRALAEQQAEALEKQWTGEWVARGNLGYFGRRLGVDRLFLDTQPWGVLGGVWTGDRRKQLFENVRTRCVAPMKAGARCLDRPFRAMHLKPGVDTNGGDWAAIDSWVAWAWSLEDPKAAWDFFLATTMATRAEAYPENWYGIWSGPDAFNGCDHPNPGATSNFVFTPMAEFPMFNMNRHSGPLLDIIKLAGICVDSDGITIEPKLPFAEFRLTLPLVAVDYKAEAVTGAYRPNRICRVRFIISPPTQGVPPWEVRLNTTAVPHEIDAAGRVIFEAEVAGEVHWEITPLQGGCRESMNAT